MLLKGWSNKLKIYSLIAYYAVRYVLATEQENQVMNGGSAIKFGNQ